MTTKLLPFCLAATVAVAFVPAAIDAQVHIRRTVPRVFDRVPPKETGYRSQVRAILGREVRLRSEYDAFVRDLTALGRRAVPDILALGGRRAEDRYVTEALLRIGGPDVRHWLDGLLLDSDQQARLHLLAGIPAAVFVDGSVRPTLARLIHDMAPQVRSLAVTKLYPLVSVHELLTRCHDIDGEVARVAILTVSREWVFLDHGIKELANLARFVDLIAGRQAQSDWPMGRGFLLAFEKDRIAESEKGRALIARIKKMPWFRSPGKRPVPSSLLEQLRRDLREHEERRAEFLSKMLKKLPPHAGAELLMVLADESDAGIRLAACKAGMQLLDPELAAGFLRFLKDGDPKVRAMARELFEQTNFYLDQKRRYTARRL